MVLVAGLCAAGVVCADNLAALRTDLAGWMNHPGLRDADVGAHVVWIPDGTVLYSLHSEQAFIPASTVKLVVTASALELLGASFQYQTLVRMQAPPDETGLVAGDVTIAGTAAPDVSMNVYNVVAQQLAAGGVREIAGDIVGTAPVRASEKDNGLRAAAALKAALSRAGITVAGQAATGEIPSRAFLVYQHQSTSLSDYLKTINKRSDNQRARSLLTSLATVFGDPYDVQHGFVAELWRERGLNVEGLYLPDGSGLSADNRLTPAFVTGLLAYLAGDEGKLSALLDSLPVAGIDGTLRYRMRHTAAQERVYAKAGTLHGASCLSGYVKVGGEAKIAFCIMMNNYKCSLSKVRRIQDRAALRLVEYGLSPPAR